VELNKAIIAYCKKSGYESCIGELEKAMGVKYEKKCEGVLERKWTIVTKLSNKALQLENEVESLREDLKNFGKGKVRDKSLVLPRAPPKHVCKGHRQPITCVVFHPIFSQVVTASEDCTIMVWDTEEGTVEKTMKGHIDTVQHVSFNQDGKQLASCSADMSIKVWNFETHICLKTMRGHEHTVSCVKFTPAGDRLVSCSRDKTIKFWDVQSGYCLSTLQGHKDWVRHVQISPCSSILASCSMDHTIRIWDYKKCEELMSFRDHSHVVDSVVFSHEKADQTLMKYVQKELNGSEQEQEKKVKTTAEKDKSQKEKNDKDKRESSTPYTPEFLASASRDKTIKIFHISSGALVTEISGHENWVREVIFHPSGKYLLSCADDKTIRVWDLEKNFRCRKIIEDAHDPFVTCIDYNMARPMVATGGVDKELKIWECH